FIRWPVDYVDNLGIPVTDDELDPFKVDFGFVASNAPAVATGATRQAPFSLRPLIVSAGSDGIFDLRFGYGTAADGSDDIRYSQMTWPDTVMGGDAAGHSSPYYYPDPYHRQNTSGGRLGAYNDQDGDGDEQRADNITNYELEVSI
ncbi:MAG: hypothetical protein HKN47_03725, partial [Pirellulaceae bacterium]|nr:hypothetical protein [Pirellulaceae bacterium]